MMPAKKAAKKAPARSTWKHDEGKDLRRAYEHQGRVLAMQAAVGKLGADIKVLTDLAEQELAGMHFKDAAELFRAAEHLSFGVLASEKAAVDVSETLEKSLKEEFEHKLDKAGEHWDDEALAEIYQHALDEAQKAFDSGAYRRALEMARAAEALAHVHLHEQASGSISDDSGEA